MDAGLRQAPGAAPGWPSSRWGMGKGRAERSERKDKRVCTTVSSSSAMCQDRSGQSRGNRAGGWGLGSTQHPVGISVWGAQTGGSGGLGTSKDTRQPLGHPREGELEGTTLMGIPSRGRGPED